MANTPFSPVGVTQNVVSSAVTQTLTLEANPSATTVRVLVLGAGAVALNFDAAAVAATSMPMLGNTVETFERGVAATLRVIAISGTPTVYVTSGVGGN